MNKVEILAPAGDFKTFKSVINAGADAVYLAGNLFGARAFAANLTNEELLEAIDYAHIHGKKLYLTVNTLVKNNELFNDMYDYLLPLYKAGLDAVIVQDYGVMSFIHDNFPGMEIHASTQMTITDSGYADFLKKYGVTRIVPARELSLEEIEQLHDKSGMEIECFIHGALCYCYSGQCFMSSFIGGRSGNRGKCAQPCRLIYEKDGVERNMLSLKDLCTLGILPDIIEAGVYSLKIEGRMKSLEYAAGVTSIYRRYVDKYLKNGRNGYSVDKKDVDRLLMLFDRGGMTNGYYVMHNGKNMIADEVKSDKSLEIKKQYEEQIRNEYVINDNKIKITGSLTLTKGSPAIFSITDENNNSAVATGAIVESAKNQAMSYDDVYKQISKFGATTYEVKNIEITMDDDIYISNKNLNELRRAVVVELMDNTLAGTKRDVPERVVYGRSKHGKAEPLKLSVRVTTMEQAEALIDEQIDRLILEPELLSSEDMEIIVKKCHNHGIDVYIGLPRIDRKNFDELIKIDADGVMIRNMSQLAKLKSMHYNGKILSDYNCYAFNNLSVKAILSEGVSELTYPIELNEKELQNLELDGGELIVYGRIPLMISANCVNRTMDVCTKPNGGFTLISDRKKAKLPVLACCKYCYNLIFNNVPIYLIDKIDSVKAIAPSYCGVIFTDEKASQVKKVIKDAVLTVKKDKKLSPPDKGFTRGHFTRGVE